MTAPEPGLDLARLHADAGAMSYVSATPPAASGVVIRRRLRGGPQLTDCRLRLDTPLDAEALAPPGLSVYFVLSERGRWHLSPRTGAAEDCVVAWTRTPRWSGISADAGATIRFLALTASADWLDEIGLRQPEGAQTIALAMPARVTALAQALAAPDDPSPAAALLREAAALEAIGLLLPSLPNADRRVAADGRITARERRALALLGDIIAGELGSDLSLAGLARRVGLSLTRLKDLHRTVHGQPVAATITEARLQRAARLLAEGDLQVAEIAYAVGYTPAHFATAFRRRFGIAPSQVRRPG